MEVLDGLIRGGARIVQLRDKDASKGDLYQVAMRFREITSKAGILLIINDHVDIALAVDADGVHLGQDDLPVEAARRIGPDLLVGISTHTLGEALAAQSSGADYINIGPIFYTGTKGGISDFLGPEAITAIGSGLEIPFTVMGGIKQTNIHEVLARGARRIAVVTALTQATDIAAAVRAMRGAISNWNG
ncbi:thiamine-phosphate synthase [bacterium BMS3Abin14]|nr:thiamine-phosphate synthase [bacterium BMS3Abin14]